MKAISLPALMVEVTPEKFQNHSNIVKHLGKLEKRNMTGFQIIDSNQRKGTYKLRFKAGVVNMWVSTNQGKLQGYNLSGPTMEKAMLEIGQLAPFAVKNFQFNDAAGQPNPTGNTYRPNSLIAYRFELHGLKVQNGMFNFKVDVAIRNAQGQVVQSGNVITKQLPASGTFVWVKGQLPLAYPGVFHSAWKVYDLHSGKALDYSQSVVVSPQ